jgi:hypothetical protein
MIGGEPDPAKAGLKPMVVDSLASLLFIVILTNERKLRGNLLGSKEEKWDLDVDLQGSGRHVLGLSSRAHFCCRGFLLMLDESMEGREARMPPPPMICFW